jgi:choline dehydrogenase-like flavoprotein
MKRLKPVDVVIAGGGWTGLLMAKEITARTSLSVVVLERGPARRSSDYNAGMDELDYTIRLRMRSHIRDKHTLGNGCQLRRVVHRNGRAEALTYMDASGEEIEQPARILILGSWTLNNTRLLPMSKIGEPYNPNTGGHGRKKLHKPLC